MPQLVEFPGSLIDAAMRGEAILFLGAGASFKCKHPDGREMPSGSDLRDWLADEFLRGDCKDRTLEEVATYVENQQSQMRLEKFVAQKMSGFAPSAGHLLLPTFRWKAIFTTNYDTLVEVAYKQNASPLQTLKPFYRDQNSIERDLASAPNPVGYFKLHGSIDQPHQPDAPLILTSDSYVAFDQNRKRLFQRLEDLAREYPIIFVGTRIADPHLKEIVVNGGRGESRPLSYFVSPNITEHDRILFAKRNLYPISMTFDQLMNGLNEVVAEHARKLAAVVKRSTHTIERHFKTSNPASDDLIAFLTKNAEHVHVGMNTSPVDAVLFFKGESQSWAPIEGAYDIERKRYEKIMLKLMTLPANGRDNVSLVTISGVAGSGKTVLSRRVAYDLATKYSNLVLFLPPGGLLRPRPLVDLYNSTGLHIFLFIDHAADHISALSDVIAELEKSNVLITIILTDTQAAFGNQLEQLAPYIQFEFELGNLGGKEVGALLAKLEEFKCLGLLADKSPAERVAAFNELGDRQLLVALYQATQGKPLEEILVDEYHRVLLNQAQELYLLICTLNMFRVPVRAGLIHRLTGIDFTDFQARFLGPLAGMVFTTTDPGSLDYAYRTRHPTVAEIVFRRILDTQSKQVNQYKRVIEAMNPTYSSDYEALKKMISARNLLQLVNNLDERRGILKIAEQVAPDDPFVLQQEALLEMNNARGDLKAAKLLLDRAQTLRPKDGRLTHTRASLISREADYETDPLMRKSLRVEARTMLRGSTSNANSDAYVQSLLAKLAVDEIDDRLRAISNSTDQSVDNEVFRLIEDAEKAIARGMSDFPDFEAFVKESMRLKRLIGDSQKTLPILERVLVNQPHLEYVAMTYARAIEKTNPTGAMQVLQKCLVERPSSKLLNQAIYLLMLGEGDQFRSELLFSLRKAYTPEDQNILMHVHRIRYHFMRGERDDYQAALNAAERMANPRHERFKPRIQLHNQSSPDGRYSGTIDRYTPAYCFIRCAGMMDRIYSRPTLAGNRNDWDSLNQGLDVSFDLYFNYRGPIALNLALSP